MNTCNRYEEAEHTITHALEANLVGQMSSHLAVYFVVTGTFYRVRIHLPYL